MKRLGAGRADLLLHMVIFSPQLLVAALSASLLGSLMLSSFLLPSLVVRLRAPLMKLSLWRWKCFLVPTKDGLLTSV